MASINLRSSKADKTTTAEKRLTRSSARSRTPRKPTESNPTDLETVVSKALETLLEDSEARLTTAQEGAYSDFKAYRDSHSDEFPQGQRLPRVDLIEIEPRNDREGTGTASLVKRSNLVSFLHLVLSSGPDPETNTRSPTNGEQLKRASLCMLKTLGCKVDGQAIRLVVDLKRQAYIASASTSDRAKASYSDEPLNSHLPSQPLGTPPFSSEAMKDFKRLQGESQKLIEQVGQDREALAAKWNWSEFVARFKAWARDQSEGGSASLEQELDSMLAEGDETAQDQKSDSLNQEAGDGDESRGESVGNREDGGDKADSDNSSSASGDRGRVKQYGTVDDDEQMASEASGSGEDEDESDSDGDEMDLDLGGVNEQYYNLGSQEREVAQQAHERETVAQEESERESFDSPQDSQRPSAGATYTNLSYGTSLNPARKARKVSAADRSSPGHKTGSAAPDGQSVSRNKLVIDNGTISVGGTRRTGPSLLDRQPDAEKIAFDSQTQSSSTSPRPEARRKSLSSEHQAASASRTSTKKKKKQKTTVPSSGSPLPVEAARQALATARQDSLRAKELFEHPEGAEVSGGEGQVFEQEDFGGGSDGSLPTRRGRTIDPDSSYSFVRPRANALKRRAANTIEGFKGFDFDFATDQQPTRPEPQPSASTSQLRHSPSRVGSSSHRIPPKKVSEQKRKSHSDDDESQSDSGISSERGGTSARKGKENGQRKKQRKQQCIIPPKRKARYLSEEEEEDSEEMAKQEARKKRAKKSENERLKEKEESDSFAVARKKGTGNPYYQGRNQPGARIRWSPDEERFFLRMLAKYGGDWKKINCLHGESGTETRRLAARTVMSLKDKAVNIKRSCLVRGVRPPHGLAHVIVPESKLRGPSRSTRVIQNETDSEDDD